MKLRTRLILSFILIVLLPMGLAMTAFIVVNHSKANSGKMSPGQLYFSNTVDDLASYTDDDVRLLEEWARTFPENFLDSDIQKQSNEKLAEKNSYLVVRVGTKIVYDGAAKGMHPDYDSLPMYGKLVNGDVLIIKLQTESGILKEIDFGKEDGKRGQAFVITPAGSVVPGGEKIWLYYVLWLVVIMLITGVVISLVLYRSIIRKVRLMQAATDDIRQGNLENRIEAKGSDELSELAQSLERMRARLLSDATQKVADEDSNRKFLSSITHDLKTPLTSIIGYSEGILDGIASDPEKLRKYVSTIHSKAVDMNELLNELSEFSKLDLHEIPYHFEKINASEYFDEFAEVTEDELSSDNADFSYKNTLDADTEIIADPAQIKRVLHNLISNALKYSRDDAKLSVKFRVKDIGNFIQAEMEDNGKGISSEDVPHVFERLFRADKARNTGIRGSGIGLSIVKKIIEDHGGQIWVTSRLNEGSTFYFVLKKVSPDDNT
ncbi:MAG: HAMP domain-containing sensor histidine kinase [Lachnospiraceae bacterium]|nr:HAMP domain-containing sensor histidine kinase [Lachnospiraceae bacterium]